MEFEDIIHEFEFLSNEENIKGKKRFGINFNKSYGLRMLDIRKIAKKVGKNHEIAIKLWDYPYHESRILAPMVEEPDKLTNEQLDKWVSEFDSWDVVDQACINLFRNSDLAISKIPIWAENEKEYVKRTAFSLIAVLAVHNKKEDDEYFRKFYPLIIDASCDNRNFVKKAVNWAIRQIGKRNINLNKEAIELSYEILKKDCKASRWIAKNAINELESDKIQKKLLNK
ncbi:DNA alkylation repair protein [Methanobrevibacter sp. 87.7]|uniref:DNA alkylation repair protein n=1 Tax=Methanobrevibacter sp. 87.7 TaxID=387957 RepID=UPI000B501CC8|nr:DNA alkylation repair protein [Methanobrevibacter sp. 87.7]OWT33864.1 DNA alkylation repair protein [Methanobrevibacter sp. 87.7]